VINYVRQSEDFLKQGSGQRYGAQTTHLNTTTMGRSKKRKIPVTTPAHKSTPKSLTTRSTICRFHVLLKRRAQLETKPRTIEVAKELEEIDQEMVSLGGLEQYQAMSVVGQSKERGGGSHKVLISWLRILHSPVEEGNNGTLKYVCLPSVRLEIHI
jgi:hypothetical protein